MNINNLQAVNDLYKIRTRCEDAIEKLESYMNEDHHKDSGGQDGFNSYLSSHSDGSGEITDMTGCYVAIAVADATLTILQNQVKRVNARLTALKVDV